MLRRLALAGLAPAVLGLALVGCGDPARDQVAGNNKSNIQRLSNLYAGYQNMLGGKGPKDEASFKAFIKEYDPNKLSMMGVDAGKVDELFKSDRDGQPFKIRFSVGGGKGSVAAVIFEQTGKDGKRMVGFTSAPPEEVDEAKYNELLAGKNATVAPPVGGPVAGGAEKGGRPRGGAPPGAPKGPNGK